MNEGDAYSLVCMNFRFDFAGNFLSPVNIYDEFTPLIGPMNFSWTFPGFAILKTCMSIGSRDSHRSPIFALHRYRFIFHVAALFDTLSAASPLWNFDACNADADVAAAGATCGDGAAKKRSTTPTQTSTRDVAAAGATCWDGAAKKRSTTATPTSTRDVAVAGATSWDGRGEEDVHNGDESERRPLLAPAAAAGGGSWPPPPPPASGEDGRAPPGT